MCHVTTVFQQHSLTSFISPKQPPHYYKLLQVVKVEGFLSCKTLREVELWFQFLQLTKGKEMCFANFLQAFRI